MPADIDKAHEVRSTGCVYTKESQRTISRSIERSIVSRVTCSMKVRILVDFFPSSPMMLIKLFII